MADVISIRGMDGQKNRFDKVSECYASKGEAFEALLKAYEESQAFADAETRIHLEHVRGLCNNLCGAFETLLIGQGAEMDSVRRQNRAELEVLQEKISLKDGELSDALERAKKLQEELDRTQKEKDTLEELKGALKGRSEALESENNALKKQLEMLEQKVAVLEQQVAKNTKK